MGAVTGEKVVYVMKLDNGNYKIGVSADPEARAKELTLGLPVGITVVHVIKATDAFRTEKMLHHHFAAKRISREWFSLDSEDLQGLLSLDFYDPPFGAAKLKKSEPSGSKVGYEFFAANLQRIRVAKGMSQKSLAIMAGLTTLGVSQLETGRRRPTWESACRLAYGLGVSLDELAKPLT